MVFWIAQAIGLIAMSVGIVSFQMKEQKRLIFFQLISTTLFSVHFFLLDAYSGAILNVIAFLRATVFYNKEKKWAQVNVWKVTFLAVNFVPYALSFLVFGIEPSPVNFLVELLPVAGMTASAIGLFLPGAKEVRAAGLVSSPAWLIYNVIHASLGGVLCECFSLVSIMIGIFRLDFRQK